MRITNCPNCSKLTDLDQHECKNPQWYVVYLKMYTRAQAFPPEKCANKEEAEARANSYNRNNQDNTWNHVKAYAVSDRCRV